MENRKEDITVAELIELLQSQEGEFIIHMEFGKEAAVDGNESIP